MHQKIWGVARYLRFPLRYVTVHPWCPYSRIKPTLTRMSIFWSCRGVGKVRRRRLEEYKFERNNPKWERWRDPILTHQLDPKSKMDHDGQNNICFKHYILKKLVILQMTKLNKVIYSKVQTKSIWTPSQIVPKVFSFALGGESFQNLFISWGLLLISLNWHEWLLIISRKERNIGHHWSFQKEAWWLKEARGALWSNFYQ